MGAARHSDGKAGEIGFLRVRYKQPGQTRAVEFDRAVSLRELRATPGHDFRFAAAVAGMPEVMEFHRMSGDVDYLLKVVAPSIEGYDRFYKKLIEIGRAHV